MKLRAARLALVAAFVLASLTSVVLPPERAVAEHLPPPSEIVLRASDLPEGFAPADEAPAPSLLPDNLARQATVSFRRVPSLAAEPGISYVRQVVLTFDERDAAEYVPRFRDLMMRHQGYASITTTETDFHLTRTRDDGTSVVVGVARGEVLVVTTVEGLAGTVGPEQAVQLTERAVARVPSVERASAALSTSRRGGVALGNATTGGKQFEYPSIEDKGRWPVPTVDLPGPPDVDVVAQRSDRPVGDPSLDVLSPLTANQVRPPDLEQNPAAYAQWVIPLIDEFWRRALDQTGHYYWTPRIVMANEEVLVVTPCVGHDGEPSLALGLAYCPLNQTIYIYEPFLKDDLVASENWQERSFVITVFLAHEWAHHIQHTHGYTELEAINAHNNPDLLPQITRQSELHADCFAGLFARHAREAGWLDLGDLDEAQSGMMRIGDTYFDSPGHHGTPEQRRDWFMRGYTHYSLRACDAW